MHTSSLSAEGAKACSKKRKRSTILPVSLVQFFSVLFSFLFVQIFPYGQVDRLFYMSHGAIPPSLMVLLHSHVCIITILPLKAQYEREQSQRTMTLFKGHTQICFPFQDVNFTKSNLDVTPLMKANVVSDLPRALSAIMQLCKSATYA